jgi:hypothetical protein
MAASMVVILLLLSVFQGFILGGIKFERIDVSEVPIPGRPPEGGYLVRQICGPCSPLFCLLSTDLEEVGHKYTVQRRRSSCAAWYHTLSDSFRNAASSS